MKKFLATTTFICILAIACCAIQVNAQSTGAHQPSEKENKKIIVDDKKDENKRSSKYKPISEQQLNLNKLKSGPSSEKQLKKWELEKSNSPAVPRTQKEKKQKVKKKGCPVSSTLKVEDEWRFIS